MWAEHHRTTTQCNLQDLKHQIADVAGFPQYWVSVGTTKSGHGFQWRTEKTYRPDGRITWQAIIYKATPTTQQA